MLKYTALALSLVFAAGCSEDKSADESEENLLCKGYRQDCPSLDWDACRAAMNPEWKPQCLGYSAQNAAGEWIHACVNECQIGLGHGGLTGGKGEYQLCFEIDGEYYGAKYGTLYDFRPEGWNRVGFRSCDFLFTDEELNHARCEGFTQECPNLGPEACRANDQCYAYSVQNAAGEWRHGCANQCRIGEGIGGVTGGIEADLCFEIDGEYYGAKHGTSYYFLPEGWNIVYDEGYCDFLSENEEDGGVSE